ncbi:MAG: DUF1376 domain-containing protein, partial [Proteobacteria bacterium]|nr:DUF1376 domain-containing protein [Pseudomonadota bacterium]
MKIDIWMPIYINDYLADTMRLNAEKHGVYFLLMMDYWKHGYIPSDIEELSLIARVSPDNKSLQYIIDNFFILKGDKYAHNRIDKELENANSRRITAVENGKKGGRPRKGNNPQDNPEKTHRLNVGKPRKNQQGNPQKSSSSSSSSSSLPTTPTTKEEKKDSPPSPDPDSNRQRFIEIKNHWKSKRNLPQSKLLDANMSLGHESLDMLKVFPNEDIFKAIDNFDKCFTKIEA